MKTRLDDRSTFTKTVNMHYKDIKEQTRQLLSSGQGVLGGVSCKNGTLRLKMAIWNVVAASSLCTEGKCQPCVSVCGLRCFITGCLTFTVRDGGCVSCVDFICILNLSKHCLYSPQWHTEIRVWWAFEWLLKDTRLIFTKLLSRSCWPQKVQQQEMAFPFPP